MPDTYYNVIVTFDLESAQPGDYELIYAGLKKLGISNEFKGSNRTVYLTTTAYGVWLGSSNQEAANDLSAKIHKIFTDNKIHGEFMVFAGTSITWTYTPV